MLSLHDSLFLAVALLHLLCLFIFTAMCLFCLKPVVICYVAFMHFMLFPHLCLVFVIHLVMIYTYTYPYYYYYYYYYYLVMGSHGWTYSEVSHRCDM
jgi:hypothetical protein